MKLQAVGKGEAALRALELADGPTRALDDSGREIISVRSLLEWAFATECATLDFDEVGAALGIGLPAAGAEYRVSQQLALGRRRGEGVRPDTSFGRSNPHDDAELVATILRNAVPFHLAVRMAELARACTIPNWDLGEQRLQPKEWGKRTRAGQHGKTAVLQVVEYVLRGRRRRREELYVPCHWVPSACQIASARRAYLDWWGGLLAVSAGLRGVELSRYVLSDHMPPMAPWQNNR
ncbi:hypothetical protein [Pacificoceanicola onchidii]|uniref:hypothetical protein n=1 Tax=Pacificoceanicola onchidii TaxID=2562685 RepID=UPI0010A482A6|nr:hypothetical protein [Pacificoceanicola onchidii]